MFKLINQQQHNLHLRPDSSRGHRSGGELLLHLPIRGSVVECLGLGFEPHRRHCVVSLSKARLPLLSTGPTQEDPSKHN